MEKPIELKVKITGKELFSFMMKHTYSRFSGLFGLGLSLVALVLLVMSFGDGDDMKAIILLVIALLFTVVNPLMLYTRAKQQALSNPVYKETLLYTLDESSISLKVNDTEESIEWEKILKWKKTGSVCILYTTDIHAILLPFSCMGDQRKKVETLIESKVRGK